MAQVQQLKNKSQMAALQSLAAFNSIVCAFAALCLTIVPSHGKEPDEKTIGQGDELNILQTYHGKEAHMRACRSYFCVDLKDYGMILISQAPDWTVQEISPKRRLYAETPLKLWLRRGVPLNFLHLGTLPDWPAVPVKNKVEQGIPVDIYALPYLTSQHRPVSVSKGTVGEMTVFSGFKDNPSGQIISTLYHIPHVDGLPLSMRLWATDGADKKYNSIFVYSGAERGSNDLVLKKLWLSKRQSLPGKEGYRLCKDSREIWVNSAETDGINELMR